MELNMRLFAVLFALCLAGSPAFAQFGHAPALMTSGGGAGAANFTGMMMTCGACNFATGSAGTIGTAQATLSAGSVSGAWSFKLSGNATTGGVCQDYQTPGYLSISGSGVISNTSAAPAQSYPGVCPQITQAGIGNSPYSQTFTFTGTSGGGVPAPAALAGFTTPILIADFTSSAYSNPSTWPGGDVCNHSGAPPKWYFTGFGNTSDAAPCARIAMVNDSGTSGGAAQVLRVTQTAADTTNFSGFNTLIWPTLAPEGATPDAYVLPMQGYFEATFRITGVDQYNGLSGGSSNYIANAIDWWLWGGCSNTTPSTAVGWLEPDFTEINNNASNPNYPYGSQILEWEPPSFNPFQLAGSGLGPTFNVTQYHKVGFLITSDGSTGVAWCLYVDGQVQQSPCPHGAPQSATLYNCHNYSIMLMTGTNGQTNRTQDFNMFVTKVQIWMCSNAQSGGNCNTALVTNG